MMNANGKNSILGMTLKELGDEVLEKLIGLVVSAEKPEQIDRLSFPGLVSRATLLAEKYSEAKDCKCIICKDLKTGRFKVGIWAIDSKRNVVSDEYGMAQKIMETMALDDKLNGFLSNGTCANFILELNK